MEPEIARRCTACGASVRGAAHFCPQCGRPMAERGAGQTTAEQSSLVSEAERVASSLEGRLAARGAEDEGRRAEQQSSTIKAETGKAEASRAERPAAAASQPASSTPLPAAAGQADAQGLSSSATAAAVQRAGDAGADSRARARVERLRERSVVVLDEAADDPGLRFVLVAAALFVVAILIFVFSFALR